MKLEQHFRLPGYKQMPELESCEREIRTLGIRLLARTGEEVPTQHLEVVDFGKGGEWELQVFLADEAVYVRCFPPGEGNA